MLSRAGRTSRFVALASLLIALVFVFAGGAWAAPAPVGAPGVEAGPGVPGAEARPWWTAKSRTWVRDDGRYVTRAYTTRVNFQDSAGRWRPIDNDLKPSSDPAFGWENSANRFRVRVPRRLGDGALRIDDGDRWLAMRLQGNDVAGGALGDEATFNGAARDVTARWRMLGDGVKEDLVLASADAAREFVFAVDLSDGLRLRSSGGVLEAVDAAGDVAFTLPTAFAQDAAGATAPKDAVSMTSERDGDHWRVTVRVDAGWLQAPGRAFPATIDPSVLPGPSGDCELDAATPTVPVCTSNELGVGYGGTTPHRERSVLKFDTSGVPKTAQVLRADLNVYLFGQTGSYPTDAISVEVHRVTSDWSATGVDWDNADQNHLPAPTPWTATGGDFDATVEKAKTSTASGAWMNWGISTLARKWVEGDTPNQGIILTDNGTQSSNKLDFASSKYGTSTQRPYLELEYFPRVGAPRDATLDSQQITDRSALGVNVANGNLQLASSDLQLPGRGLNLGVTRTFNAQEPWKGQTGWGGRLSVGLDQQLYDISGNDRMVYVGPGGQRFVFEPKGDGVNYVTPPGIDATLTKNATSGRWRLTDNKTGTYLGFFANSASFADEVVDRHGNRIDYTYQGPNGQLSKITDSQGKTVTVTTDSSTNMVTSIKDDTLVGGSTRTWQYGYEPTRRLLNSVTDPDGKQTLYHYDANYLLDEITDPRGTKTSIAYDGSQRVTSVTRQGDPATSTDDRTTTYAYPGTLSAPCTDTAKAPGTIGMTTVTDPLSHVTKYCWNAKGQVVYAEDANGVQRSTHFTPNGDADVFQGLAGTANPATTTLTYDFTPGGSDNTFNLRHGLLGAGEEFDIQYKPDVAGTRNRFMPSQYTDTQGTTEFYDYNSTLDLTSVRDESTDAGSRNKATLAYNTDGTLQYAEDGEQHRTNFDYFANGNLKTIKPPILAPSTGTQLGNTALTYDPVSRVSTVTDGKGSTRTLTYDKEDRVTRVDLSNGFWMTFSFDNNGNLTQRQDSAGNTTTYVYDRFNARTSETFPGARSNTYTYDKAGNLKTLADGSGTVTYNYDPGDRLSSVVAPNAGNTGNETVGYAYNDTPDANKLVSVTQSFPGTVTQQIVSDLSGKPVSIVAKDTAGAGTVLRSLDYTYTNGSLKTGQVQTMKEKVGTNAQTTTSYTYKDTTVCAGEDVGRLLKARQVTTSSGAFIKEWRYCYDKAGNRTKREIEAPAGTTATTTYAYNADNELCWSVASASSNTCASAPTGATSYSFDANGNQTTGGYGYDALDRLTTIGPTSLGYLSPTNGELVSYGTTSFQNNMLGLGRIIGSSTTSIVRDPTGGAPISQRDGSTKQFLLADNLGSTVGLLQSGAIARSYSYDPDGQASTSGSGATTALQFAGGHSVAGLYHFGARYYDPANARWTQADALRQYDDLTQANRYSYVGGDPINGADPTGLAYHNNDGSYPVKPYYCRVYGPYAGCAAGIPPRGTNSLPGPVERCLNAAGPVGVIHNVVENGIRKLAGAAASKMSPYGAAASCAIAAVGG